MRSGGRRRPECCEYRHAVRGHEAPRTVCALARRFLVAPSALDCEVDDPTCEACCRHDLPGDSSLNPVVASLLYTAADGAGQENALDPREQVENHQVRQFARRWLTSWTECRGTSIASSDSHPGTTVPEERSSAETESRIEGRPRIGLAGRHSRYGLGHQNRDIVSHLIVERWLIPRCDEDDPPANLPCRVDVVSHDVGVPELEAWLDGLDVVMFVESPAFTRLTSAARRRGVRVVCIPNWEWLHPGLEWLDDVDLMICPTRFTARRLVSWKRKFGFRWTIDCVPWPIDTRRIRFRRRSVCRRFVVVNGSGGVSTVRPDGTPTGQSRKGLDVLFAAARRIPEVPIIVYASVRDRASVPRNVDLRPRPADNRLLYCDGDVCVQPSRWEGLGLPLLECQAAGMPLITTDLPPMNEHRPWAAIPARAEPAYLRPDIRILAARICPVELAGVLRSVHGRRIAGASRRARRFVRREHSWIRSAERIRRAIATLFTPDALSDMTPSTLESESGPHGSRRRGSGLIATWRAWTAVSSNRSRR